MAFSNFTGQFTQPIATNASFAVTGVGFQPKAILLYATDETATGISTNYVQYFGMATATTNRAAISVFQTSGGASMSRAHDDTKCFIAVSAAGTTLTAADLVSFDADGFTLNFSTVSLVARIVNFVALGGTDLTNAFIKEFKPAASNTNQAFTGVGFKPDAMFLMSAQNGTAPPNADTTGAGIILGFAKDSTHRGVAQNQSSSATESQQMTNKIIEKSSGGGSDTMEADLVSFDSDGFTLGFTVSSSVKYCFALCLKGGSYNVGSFNQKTTTGSQAITGAGFAPRGVTLLSTNLTSASTLNTTNCRISFGSGSSSSARGSIWAGGGGAGVTDNDTDNGKIINMITEGVTPTTNASADLTSLDSDGFTLNWTSADTTAREILYWVFGDTPIGAASSVPAMALMGVG